MPRNLLSASCRIPEVSVASDEALLAGRIDLGIHSLKDLPTVLPDGIALAAKTAQLEARSGKPVELCDPATPLVERAGRKPTARVKIALR